MKFIKKGISSVLFIYALLSALSIFYSGGFNTINMTTDFDHYNRFWNEFTNFDLSYISRSSYESYMANQKILNSWIPNPFYSLIALFPITLLGSPALLKIIGFCLGIIYLNITKDLIKDFINFINIKISSWQFNFLLIAICSNRWFIKGTLGMSTMFLCSFFFILGLKISNRLFKSIFFSFSILIRPNFIIFLFPFFIFNLWNDLFRNKAISKVTYSCILPLTIFPFWYLFIDSTYPGSTLSMLFYSKGQGFDWTIDYFFEILKSSDLIIPSLESELFKTGQSWDLTISEFVELISSNIGFIFFFIKIYILKIFVGLGMRFELALNLPSQGGGWYLAEMWSLFYFIFISLPGFIVSILLVLFKKLSFLEHSTYIVSLIYIFGTHLFLGDPRYSLLVMPTLIFALIRGINILRDSPIKTLN